VKIVPLKTVCGIYPISILFYLQAPSEPAKPTNLIYLSDMK